MVDDGINTSNNNNNNPEGEDREINLYAVFFKYMVYWPWFVASVLACCIGMYVFLRYQTPVYNVTSSVLIKEDEKKGANAASGLAAIQDLGMLSMTSNFDNEVEILRSRTLIKKVVNDMGLYIDMEESNALGFNPPLYKNSPVNVFITPEEADRLVAPVELRMRYTKEGQLTVRAEYKLTEAGIRAEMDARSEKIGYKIREAQMQKIPYMLVVGDRDMENGTVSPRHRADGDLGAMSMDEFSALLKQVVDNKEKK